MIHLKDIHVSYIYIYNNISGPMYIILFQVSIIQFIIHIISYVIRSMPIYNHSWIQKGLNSLYILLRIKYLCQGLSCFLQIHWKFSIDLFTLSNCFHVTQLDLNIILFTTTIFSAQDISYLGAQFSTKDRTGKKVINVYSPNIIES